MENCELPANTYRADFTRSKTDMIKRRALWVVGIGVLASVGLLAAAQGVAVADDGTPKCTNATLKGRYLFAAPGIGFPPAFGVTEQSVGAAAGYHVFDGNGHGKDYVTFVLNGVVQLLASSGTPGPAPLTYQINQDCTGFYTVDVPGGPTFDIFVSPDGEWLSAINTNPGSVAAYGPDRRVAPR